MSVPKLLQTLLSSLLTYDQTYFQDRNNRVKAMCQETKNSKRSCIAILLLIVILHTDDESLTFFQY